jgi:microcystin degradation protein MlrC
MEPAKSHYAELLELDQQHGTMLSFCMGFPAADFPGCGATVWGYGDDAERTQHAVQTLYSAVAEPSQWRLDVVLASQAVARALAIAETASKPVVIADTQDNPGAGGDSNTTGMLHALLAHQAGQRWPGRIVLGMLFDEAAARRAHAVGVGGSFEGSLGKAVPTFTGQASDPPVSGRFTVKALSDGQCTLKGPMMTGMQTRLGASACLELDGILIAVVSGKAPAAGPRDAAHAGYPAGGAAPHRRQEQQPLSCRLHPHRQRSDRGQGSRADGGRSGGVALEEALGVRAPGRDLPLAA